MTRYVRIGREKGTEAPCCETPPNHERDIMFLSMVADPERCHALSGNAHDQRFNVAASRARDRAYLVRSVTAEQLSPRRASG
jgi:superfamily I DNA and/or RNA helicase